MTSTFAWLDHSEEQRRRMMEVVGLFREKGTLDELGIGTVRDAVSDLLFPGTSTLHTRARYLLFVPWIFLRLEEQQVAARDAPDRLRDDEVRLIYALDRGDAGDGIIGIEARANLRQFPSTMYWTALDRYGVRHFPGTRAQYLRGLDGHYARRRAASRTADDDLDDRAPRNWHAGIPPAPDGFLNETTFVLSPEEADYLVERIRDRCADSYLAYLVSRAVTADGADGPWTHPAAPPAGTAIAEHLDHARALSLVMHGASLLYGLILAEKVRDARSQGLDTIVDSDAVDEFRGLFDDWVDRMQRDADLLARWDRTRFWALVYSVNPRVPLQARRFISAWIEIATADPAQIAGNDIARRHVIARERAVKGGRARVANQRALERWSGRSGRQALEFRWSQVRDVVDDIVAGLAAPVGATDA